MKTGWLELLLIALCIFWLINANKKRRILDKVESQVDRKQKEKSETKTKPKVERFRDAEDVDYVEVKD